MLIILPPPTEIISGNTACEQITVPSKFTSTVRHHSIKSALWNGPIGPTIPALFTSRVMGPQSFGDLGQHRSNSRCICHIRHKSLRLTSVLFYQCDRFRQLPFRTCNCSRANSRFGQRHSNGPSNSAPSAGHHCHLSRKPFPDLLICGDHRPLLSPIFAQVEIEEGRNRSNLAAAKCGRYQMFCANCEKFLVSWRPWMPIHSMRAAPGSTSESVPSLTQDGLPRS